MKENNKDDAFLLKRQERQKKLRKRRLKIFFICFFAVLLIIFVILSLTVLFPIKNITAVASSRYSDGQIIKYCGIEKGDNLFTVSQKNSLERLKKSLPYIETVEFERTIPDTLKLKVTEAREYVCYEIGGNYFVVSQNNWVLDLRSEKPENLPLIISDSVKCKVGCALEFKGDKNDEVARRILSLLKENKIEVDYVDITEQLELKAKIDGRFLVDFGADKDLEPKIKHLKSMIEKIGKNDTGKIDLSMWNSQNKQSGFVQTDIK